MSFSLQDIYLESCDVHIWIFDLDTFEKNLSYKDKLPIYEVKKSLNIKFDIQRERYLKRKILFRRLLGHYLDLKFYSGELKIGCYGKPYLPKSNGNSDLFFNSADADKMVIFGFTRHSEIGVDIEKIKSIEEIDILMERIFSAKENNLFKSMKLEEKESKFYKLWTRKESLTKAMGIGLNYPINLITLIGDSEFGENKGKFDFECWEIYDLNIGKEYAAAFTVKKTPFNLKIFKNTKI